MKVYSLLYIIISLLLLHRMFINIICGEHGIRPGNINGGGGKTPTSELIDMFPMADGKTVGFSI